METRPALILHIDAIQLDGQGTTRAGPSHGWSAFIVLRLSLTQLQERKRSCGDGTRSVLGSRCTGCLGRTQELVWLCVSCGSVIPRVPCSKETKEMRDFPWTRAAHMTVETRYNNSMQQHNGVAGRHSPVQNCKSFVWLEAHGIFFCVQKGKPIHENTGQDQMPHCEPTNQIVGNS